LQQKEKTTIENQEIIEQIRQRFAALRFGEPLHLRNLTFFPIMGESGHEPIYQLLQDAIAEKSAFVSEVSEGGSVPTCKVENWGTKPLLIPDGEILIGAKRNRLVNITVIVAASASFTLPVNCVERGRWHSVSSYFQSAYYVPPRLRADKVHYVQHQTKDGAHSDQGEVWDNVHKVLHDPKASSATSSLTDACEAQCGSPGGYKENLVLPEKALGVLVALGDEVIGMDLFDCPRTLKKLWRRLSEVYFLEAARNRHPQNASTIQAAEEFLIRVPLNLHVSSYQIGAGKAFDISGTGLVGTAVWFEGNLCHVSAFATAEKKCRDRNDNVVQ
jgi:hypothetical protein